MDLTLVQNLCFGSPDESRKRIVNIMRRMGPEVLVMHRPTIHFDILRAENVYTLLHEFVEYRGIELAASERERRRPRTCFMTSSSFEEAKRADMRIEVGEVGTGVVRELSVAELLKKKVDGEK